MKFSYLKNILSQPRLLLAVYILIAVLVGLQRYMLHDRGWEGREYTQYNNYVIFKYSFDHLSEGKDLYDYYPDEYMDLYKYSPAFALFMAPFAVLPDLPGLMLWNLLNALLLFIAISKLPGIRRDKIAWILWFVLIELITSLQNSQSNALITALIILGFVMLEKRQLLLATLFLSLSVFIKPFGLVAFSLFLLYPQKLKFVLYSVFWFLVLIFVPLILTSPSALMIQYQRMLDMLQTDHNLYYGYSVMGWLESWFGLNPNKYVVVLLGALIFMIPFIRMSKFSELTFRTWILSSILIWVVIFNHLAESPTFIIAVTGAAIWFFSQKFSWENLVLIILVFVFASLSPTDIFPRSWLNSWVKPYAIKAVPLIFVWIKIIIDLIRYPVIEDSVLADK